MQYMDKIVRTFSFLMNKTLPSLPVNHTTAKAVTNVLSSLRKKFLKLALSLYVGRSTFMQIS